MGIVSSSYTIDAHTQADGSRYVTETHTDSEGRVYNFGPYKVSSESIVNDLLTNRIEKIDRNLAESEIDTVLKTNISIILIHQTMGEFATRFWHRVSDAYVNNKEMFSYLIWWLYNRVTAGNFTSNDVRLSYNAYYNKSLTITQWNNLVSTRIVPIRDRYQAMLDEVIV